MQVLAVNPHNPEETLVEVIKQALIDDKVVAFPTDTVYGLGVDIYDEAAIAKVFQIKGRSLAKGLIAMIGSLNQLELVVKHPPRAALTLMKNFWPGGLTLIMEAQDSVPNAVKVNSTIGVRLPNHLLVQKIIQASGFPLATTSANISRQPSAVTAGQVIGQLDGLVDLVVDGGPAYGGKESTIVDVTADPPQLVRDGAVSWQQIKEVLFLA